jgi:hypothetical protein
MDLRIFWRVRVARKNGMADFGKHYASCLTIGCRHSL